MYSDFLILASSILEYYTFLGIDPFCPDCLICWPIVVCNIFLQSTVFLWCQLLLLFYFWFYLFGSSLFSLWVWLKVYLFKEPALGFIDVLYFFIFYFFSVLIFIISFLLLSLGFVCCSFSNSFKCKVGLLIWAFTFFFFFFETGL